MARRNCKAEQVIGMSREVVVLSSQTQSIGAICHELGISENTYYRWRREYGGLKVFQALPAEWLTQFASPFHISPFLTLKTVQ